MMYFLKSWKKILGFIVAYVLILGTFQYLTALAVGVDVTRYADSPQTTIQTLALAIANLLGTILTVWLFLKYKNKRRFLSVGFQAPPYKDLVYGFLTGFLIMTISFYLLLWLHQINLAAINFRLKYLVLIVVVYVAIAFTEEILMRGYVLNKLMRHCNKWTALIMSAILFSAMHFLNPHINFLAVVNLFLAGILLGLPYIFTKNLWFSISLHFSWNLFQGLLGFSVSGNALYSIFIQSRPANTIWNGGAFGYEGSVLCLFFQVIVGIIIYMLYSNRKTIS